MKFSYDVAKLSDTEKIITKTQLKQSRNDSARIQMTKKQLMLMLFWSEINTRLVRMVPKNEKK